MKTFIEKHKLLNRPFAEIVIWSVLANAIIMFVFGILVGIIEEVTGKKDSVSGYIVIIIGGLLLLLFFYRHYSPCFKGFGWFQNCKQKDVIICTAIFVGVDIIINIFDMVHRGMFTGPSLEVFICALQPGITEEITDRILPLAAAMYIFKERKYVAVPLIFTSALFGAGHIVNLFAGADLGITVLQIFSAGAAGIFMGAVYIRTGSFLPGMVVHFLHDFLSFMEYGVSDMTGNVDIIDIAEVIIFSIVQIVLTYFLIKGKSEDIKKVWDKIWVSELFTDIWIERYI